MKTPLGARPNRGALEITSSGGGPPCMVSLGKRDNVQPFGANAGVWPVDEPHAARCDENIVCSDVDVQHGVAVQRITDRVLNRR